MKVLIAGGVFRHSLDERRQRQPTPEMVLAEGLQARGVEVATAPLESVSAVARSSGFDIVHVHHLSKAAVAAAVSPRAAPLIFTAHGMAEPARRREALGARVVFRGMRAGICLSKEELAWRLGRDPSLAPRLHVVPNGLDLPDVTPVTRTLGPDEPIRGLFVGQLIAVKQIERIIVAMEREPRLHLDLVFHNEHLRGELQAIAQRAGVLPRVRFLGQLRGSALFGAYRQAHVLFLPSRSEALPSVVTEALSTGLPVVASRVGGIPSQVRDAGILVHATGDEEIPDALQRLTQHYGELAGRASLRAREISAEFSVPAMVERHLVIYRAVLEGNA